MNLLVLAKIRMPQSLQKKKKLNIFFKNKNGVFWEYFWDLTEKS
jgi:hypothetical protein